MAMGRQLTEILAAKPLLIFPNLSFRLIAGMYLYLSMVGKRQMARRAPFSAAAARFQLFIWQRKSGKREKRGASGEWGGAHNMLSLWPRRQFSTAADLLHFGCTWSLLFATRLAVISWRLFLCFLR